MREVKIYFKVPDGNVCRITGKVDKDLDATKHILEITMAMIKKKHGVVNFFCEIHDVAQQEKESMNDAATITVNGLLERLDNEYDEHQRGWMQMTPDQLIERSKDISVIQAAKDYIKFVAEDGKANLEAYGRSKNILEDFRAFQSESLDGSLTEETVREFEDYLLEYYQ